MVSRDLQRSPNELQRGAWNHQIHEKHEKVKSNENIDIYTIFERLEKSSHFMTAIQVDLLTVQITET